MIVNLTYGAHLYMRDQSNPSFYMRDQSIKSIVRNKLYHMLS